VHVALQRAARLDETALMVVVIPDSGARYLSKIYNDNWMRENQYLESTLNVPAGEVLAGKSRRTDGLLAIPLATPIQDAVAIMREHAISQLPVVESNSVVGSINEARILDILVKDPSARTKPVAEYMGPPFPVLPSDASINIIAGHMKDETTAVIIQTSAGDALGQYDIITKSDLILYLTRVQGAVEDSLR